MSVNIPSTLQRAGVTYGIASKSPLEGGPATEAMLQGENLVRASWGHYASTLLEYWSEHGVDYSPEAVLDLLGITTEDLRNDQTLFSSDEGFKFNNYRRSRMDDFTKQSEAYFRFEASRLTAKIDTIQKWFEVPEEEKDETEVEYTDSDDDYEFAQATFAQEASESGVKVSLDEFVAIMLSVDTIQPGEFQSELATAWLRGVKEVISSAGYAYLEYDCGDMDKQIAGKTYVGIEAFTLMKSTINRAEKEVGALANEMWQTIEPAFIAPKLEKHPLVTGIHN